MRRIFVHVVAPVILFIARNVFSAQCIVYEHENGKGWEKTISEKDKDYQGGMNLDGQYDKALTSVLVENDSTLVLLYTGRNAEEEALLIYGKGLHNVPKNWNDKSTFVRVIDIADIGKNPWKTIKAIAQLKNDRDQIYDVRLLPPAKAAEKKVRDDFAQGNERKVEWEYLKVHLKDKKLKGKLYVRHRQNPGNGLPFVYSVETSPEFTVDAEGELNCVVNVGRGINIDCAVLLAFLSL